MQVSDNLPLLELMLKDAALAPNFYKTTNYWSIYEKRLVPELRRLGLSDFRRRYGSVLSSFGATDLVGSFGKIDLFKNRVLHNRITRRIPLWLRFLSFQNYLLNKIFPCTNPYDVTLEGLRQLACEYVYAIGEKFGAKSLDKFEVSLIGNPEDVIKIGGRVYTMPILYYYLKYVYCQSYLNFDDVEIMVELGCGSGKQVEVIKKLHPNSCFLLFDIPPQLYVCEQYLSAVFPGSVVSYQDTRNMDSLPGNKEGKIFIFGNWKFPILNETQIDLFWNASSFQEMEPDVVMNYLSYINKQARAVFLEEMMGGKEVARKEGSHGVLKQTTLEDYRSGLANFQLLNMSPCRSPLGMVPGYSNSFWERI